MRLFGTSGVRGTLDKLTPELALRLGMAFSTFVNGAVGVGRDTRFGSELLSLALMSGIMYVGNDVIYYGVTSTPSALHASKSLGLKGSAMVTGSHTPPEIHGILLFEGDTSELHGEHETMVERILSERSFHRADWRNVGQLSEEDPDRHYLEDLLEVEIEPRKLKVVVDGGHSPIVRALKGVFDALEFDYVVYNGKLDGTFPNRAPEPDENSLARLGAKVREEGADLGISFDGDGDRAIFVDEKGEVIPPDYLGTLLAMEYGKPGDVVVCPINTSRVVTLLADMGIRVVYTKIGPPAIVDALLKEGGLLGFEESGKYIWPDNLLYGDPLYTLIKLVNLAKRPSNLFKKFPKYFRKKKSYYCPDELKGEVLKRVRELTGQLDGSFSHVDGVRVDFREGWFLIRPSGTEPLFRLYAEAETPQALKRLFELGESLLKEALKVKGSACP